MLVAKCRGFSNAEGQASYTQSAISKQVKAVENEFHVKLFNRDARHFSVTREGEIFLKYAEEIVESYSKLTRAMQMAKTGEVGRVCLGFTTKYAGGSGEKELVSGFLFEHPEVEVSTVNTAGSEVIPMVESGKVDTGLVILSGQVNLAEFDDKFCMAPFRKSRVKFAVGKGHRLYNKNSEIELADLAEERIFLPPFAEPGFEKYGLSHRFEAECRALGIEPTIIRRSEYGGVRALYAAKGMVVPFCSQVSMNEYKDIRFLYLKDDPFPVDIWLVALRSNMSATLEKFMDYARCQYEMDPGEKTVYYT